jgi:hypothetical protein
MICYYLMPSQLISFGFFFKQFMEVIKLESMGHYREDMIMAGDIFLLQVSLMFLLIYLLHNVIAISL